MHRWLILLIISIWSFIIIVIIKVRSSVLPCEPSQCRGSIIFQPPASQHNQNLHQHHHHCSCFQNTVEEYLKITLPPQKYRRRKKQKQKYSDRHLQANRQTDRGSQIETLSCLTQYSISLCCLCLWLVVRGLCCLKMILVTNPVSLVSSSSINFLNHGIGQSHFFLSKFLICSQTPR